MMDKKQEEQSNRSLHEQINFLELQVKFLCHSFDDARKQTLLTLGHVDELLKSDIKQDTIKVLINALMDDLKEYVAKQMKVTGKTMGAREFMEEALSAAQEEWAKQVGDEPSPF